MWLRTGLGSRTALIDMNQKGKDVLFSIRILSLHVYICLCQSLLNPTLKPSHFQHSCFHLLQVACRVFNSGETQTRSTRQLNKGHVWSDIDCSENGCLPFTVNHTTLLKWLIKGIIHPKLKRHPFTTDRQGRRRLG